MQHTAAHCNTLNTLQHTATHYRTLQHTTAHYSTLQHTAHMNVSCHAGVFTTNTQLMGTLQRPPVPYPYDLTLYVRMRVCVCVCVSIHTHT